MLVDGRESMLVEIFCIMMVRIVLSSAPLRGIKELKLVYTKSRSI